MWFFAVVPLVCAFIAKKKGDASSWKVFGAVAVVAALVGAVCLRMAFYNLGLSSFLYYFFVGGKRRGKDVACEPAPTPVAFHRRF